MKALKVLSVIGIVLSGIGIFFCWVNIITYQNTWGFVDMVFYGFFLGLSIVAKVKTIK
jgi:hypothetical protein